MLRAVAFLCAVAVVLCDSHDPMMPMGGGMEVVFNNWAGGSGMGGMGGMGMGGHDMYKYMMHGDDDDMTAKKKFRTLDSHDGDDDDDDDDDDMMEMMYKMKMGGPYIYYEILSDLHEDCAEHIHHAMYAQQMHHYAMKAKMFCETWLAACDDVAVTTQTVTATNTDGDAVSWTLGDFADVEACTNAKMQLAWWMTNDWEMVGECMGANLMDAISQRVAGTSQVTSCEAAAGLGDCEPSFQMEKDMMDMMDMMDM